MIAGSHVRLDKVSTKNLGVLDDGYYLKGHLVNDIAVGHTVIVDRYERAARDGETKPQKITGLYVSSPVQSLSPTEDPLVTLVNTLNSQWKVTQL